MRQVGVIASQELAQRFGDYLLSLGIGSQVREAREGFAVWVYDEDAVKQAEREFGVFAAQPDEARFQAAVARAQTMRQAAAAETAQSSTEVAMPRTWARAPGLLDAPVTLALIVASVLVSLWAQFGDAREAVMQLVMTRAAFHDEPWRAVLPIFLHFGPLHLLFNMLWLRDLGGRIEALKGWGFLALLVVGVGVISNTAQYLVTGAGFGGMSGVVYGLFGYVWVKSRREPCRGSAWTSRRCG